MELKRLVVPIVMSQLMLGTSYPVWAKSSSASEVPSQSKSSADVSVVAVVGDDIVTTLDVKNRLALAIVATGLSPDSQTKQRLIPQIVQSLINEHLYMQEAKRLKIGITDKEIQEGLEELASQNNKSLDEFKEKLDSTGVPLQTLEDKIQGELAWSKVIRQTVVPRIKVSDAEVNEVIEQLSSIRSQRMIGIEQIILPVDEKANAKKLAASAEKLVSEIKRGLSFQAIAQQFSTVKIQHNEDVLWVQDSEVDKELAKALKGLKEGDVTDPIRTPEGYLIVKFHGIKDVVDVHGDKAEVTMKQLFLPLPEDSKKIPELKKKLEKLRDSIKSCESYDSIDEKSIPDLHVDSLTIGLNAIHPELRSVVESQPVGKPGDVVVTTAGLHLVTVCERSLPERQLPDKAKIQQVLQMKKVELKAKYYLRDLRRKIFIEIKE